jgi:hypothetical protein
MKRYRRVSFWETPCRVQAAIRASAHQIIPRHARQVAGPVPIGVMSRTRRGRKR